MFVVVGNRGRLGRSLWLWRTAGDGEEGRCYIATSSIVDVGGFGQVRIRRAMSMAVYFEKNKL